MILINNGIDVSKTRSLNLRYYKNDYLLLKGKQLKRVIYR